MISKELRGKLKIAPKLLKFVDKKFVAGQG
jgi:hypothetical protein